MFLWSTFGSSIFFIGFTDGHKHFDGDFILCGALTNEVINAITLQENDLKHYKVLQEMHMREYEATQWKRKQEQNSYCEHCQMCLSVD